MSFQPPRFMARLIPSVIMALIAACSGNAFAHNEPPPGFEALFNGRDLDGWCGFIGDFPGRAKLSETERARKQGEADARMGTHWRVEEGTLVFDGKGHSLVTGEDFDDVELFVDWMILPGGDSGIYLRGTPQVQIWDNPIGSGGLYNNQKHASKPFIVADNPPGAWNTFRIVMIGEQVSVWLNDINVVEDVTLENYWDRSSPVATRGPIELQSHGSVLRFRNIFARRITDPEAERDLLRDHRMDWWRQARFGMFIHWGLYAVHGGHVDGQSIPGDSAWMMHQGQIPAAEYAPYIEQFNPVKFDAEKWAATAANAGMRYLVITTKHHDGFSLFDSAHTEWDVMSSPFQRDIMRELAEACRHHGIRVGWYHSILDWTHDEYLPRRTWDPRNGVEADFDHYVSFLHDQVTELLTDYGPIDVMWFDGEWENTWTRERGRALYTLVRRLQPNIIINNRVDKGRKGMAGLTRDDTFLGDFGTPEQEVPATGLPGVDWESCMTMNDSWGFRPDDQNWKSSAELIRTLVDIASKGGNFLLNVSPTALGEFPPESVERLEAIGDWLHEHGQAIYGTQAGPLSDLSWGRCTQRRKPDGITRLYLHVFEWPKDGTLTVPGLRNRDLGAYALGARPQVGLTVTNANGDLLISVPNEPPHDIVSVIVLDIEGLPLVESGAVP